MKGPLRNESLEPSNGSSVFDERVCRRCGKTYIHTHEYVYGDYCSWGCLQASRRRKEAVVIEDGDFEPLTKECKGKTFKALKYDGQVYLTAKYYELRYGLTPYDLRLLKEAGLPWLKYKKSIYYGEVDVIRFTKSPKSV